VADEQKQTSEPGSAEQAAEQLKSIRVADLLVQAASGLISLGSVRLAGDQRDLAQARLAIDSLRALEPVVRGQLSAELADELLNAVSGMQLAFAEAASAQSSAAAPVAEPAAEPEDGTPPAAAPPGFGE
jgi:hypothetical protein